MWPFASLSTVCDGHCVARSRLGVSVTTNPANRIQNISLCSRKFESEKLLRLTAALDYGKTVKSVVALAGGESCDIPPTWSDDYIGWN
ncbi:uncharacterized protein ANIA_11279 [Aspergillus nidulans FGSC A4]|uniref:Uncharacterized protein n=1 Tax=Emericella nidulans (strain FGSC A4 / ATCC 38163 / CBS 112.46 / NRRL 194 / M139) TaxID=227321 RepID=C8VRR1_EMENI|nr:hypothetical protein [Aspergillus nidulans FGSC A4]CBF88993.1 TPA: hypothetical protein ANIA_11279 [Aspergillus nidulans FGSC A4]